MNIGIVTCWYECGAGYVSRAYMNVLSAQGNEVWIYARGGRLYPRGDPNWDLPDVTWSEKYSPIGRISRFDGRYVNMLHFENWLRRHDIEVIIFNEEYLFDTVQRTSQLGYIVGAYIDYYKKDTVRQFGIYDFLLCNTQRHYSVFRDFPNCLFIRWGTDIDLFKPKPLDGGESIGDEVVFFHSAGWGGINNRKGTDLVLKAFQKVKGNAKLILQSQVPLSKYGDEAADIVKNDCRIQFIEKQVTAPGLYHHGDVFVYPSRLEGIGLCISEALACGLPVITTDTAPMNEFIEAGVNGMLVRVKNTRTREDGYYWPETIVDINDLARNMQVYVDDKELLILHKKQARMHANKNFDWMNNASELTRNLQNIVTECDKRRRLTRFREKFQWLCECKYLSLQTAFKNKCKEVQKRMRLA